VNEAAGDAMTTLDQLTLVTVPITPFFNAIELPPATAFIWERRGNYYLITNWHVVAARNAETGENLLKTACRPNRLSAQFNIRVGRWGKKAVDIPIRDASDDPMWLIHRTHNTHHRIDVVAIPLDGIELPTLLPVNRLAADPLKIVIGMDVFILGYPFGSEPPAFPVWKRGSIASEPDLARLTTEYYLIDTASRPGMSGSPVILRSWTNLMETPGILAMNDKPYNRFIGIYSGRLTAAKDEAQIGMVWHEALINEIIDGNRLDK
jgi:hypothetical protein